MPAERAGTREGSIEAAAATAASILTEAEVRSNMENCQEKTSGRIECGVETGTVRIRPVDQDALQEEIRGKIETSCMGGFASRPESDPKSRTLKLSLQGVEDFQEWAVKVSFLLDQIKGLLKALPQVRVAPQVRVTPRLQSGALQEPPLFSRSEWKACAVDSDPFDLAERPCIVGVSSTSVSDLTAAVFLFQVEDGHLHLLTRFWIPEDALKEPGTKGTLYAACAKGEWLTVTPGGVTDLPRICREIREFAETHPVLWIAHDPWNAIGLTEGLRISGFKLVGVRQGFSFLSPVLKDLPRFLRSGALTHDDNPLMEWMADNLAVEQDGFGNLKPSMEKSPDRIDGLLALFRALASRVGEEGVMA